MTDINDIPDYTILDEETTPHRFKVAGDIFEAAPVLPAPARRLWKDRIMNCFDGAGNFISETEDISTLADAMGEFLDLVLLPESAALLVARMKDTVRPISDDQAAMMVIGLIGHYAGRPTQPSMPSSVGRLIGGTNSTAGAPHVESIPASSPSTGT